MLALSPTQASAACKALFMDAAWETKLEKTKWGGPKKTGKERQVDMLCYLSELLDELLMNKMMVLSDSPGFEGGTDREIEMLSVKRYLRQIFV